MIVRLIPLGALALVLTACQALVGPYPEDSPFYMVPAGSSLVLTEAITFPPGRARVYVQGGEVRPHGGVNRYEPYCRLHLRIVPETAYTLQPGEMRVQRVSRQTEYVQSGPVQVAGLLGSIDDGGPVFSIEQTVFRLQSAAHPVHRMVCEHWQEFARARHVTMAEIRRALNPVLRLEAP
jgi:hypothetical protein